MASPSNAQIPAVLQAVVRQMRELFGYAVDFDVETPNRRVYTIWAYRRERIEGADNIWAEMWEVVRLNDPRYVADHMSLLMQELLGEGLEAHQNN
jgi:hypothetical protein